MPTPISRFIGGYSNRRQNPFTGADMAVDKTEDHVSIPSGAPFALQLLEVPRKDSPSSVSVYNYDDAITMTEVAVSPTVGQYRVDYPLPEGEGSGLIEFNAGDAGKEIRISYKATGSAIVTEFLDTFVPWPSPTPGENQVVILKGGVPTWSYLSKRYFHEGNVLHHPAGEDESSVLLRFKKGANDSKVFLDLMGAKLHQGWYTELKEHNHGGVAQSNGGHSHNGPSHTHSATLNGQSEPFFYGGEIEGQMQVSVTGNTGAAGDGATTAASDHTHPIDAAGGSPKTYPDSLKVYIDGVDKTANILSLSGLAKLGDGSAGHAFITAGTGELDITALLGAGTIHTIKITEPTANKGGRVLAHLEVY